MVRKPLNHRTSFLIHDRSLCPATGSTVSHMSACCYHFNVSCYSTVPLEQELDDSHLVPDQGSTPDVPRLPTGSASGVIGLCWQCAAELCYVAQGVCV
jgi:hypothetical protein